MTTRQISFSVQGMFCAKCAASIERALTPLDGVAAAHVNYAAERASVMYDPARVTTGAIVQAVRGQGFAVPTELVTVYSNDLLYATFSRSIERWLARAEGIVKVSANIVARQVSIDIIPEAATREGLTRQLARFGFHAVEALSPDAWAEFVARGMVIARIPDQACHDHLKKQPPDHRRDGRQNRPGYPPTGEPVLLKSYRGHRGCLPPQRDQPSLRHPAGR